MECEAIHNAAKQNNEELSNIGKVRRKIFNSIGIFPLLLAGFYGDYLVILD